jgi:hypothetical protein
MVSVYQMEPDTRLSGYRGSSLFFLKKKEAKKPFLLAARLLTDYFGFL